MDGLDLLLEGNVGLGSLLGPGHATRMAVPGHLQGKAKPQLVRDPKMQLKYRIMRVGKALESIRTAPFPLASGFLPHQSSYRWLFLLHQRCQYAAQPTVSSCFQYPDLDAVTEQRQGTERKLKPGALLTESPNSPGAE